MRPSEDTKGGNEKKAKMQVCYQHWFQVFNQRIKVKDIYDNLDFCFLSIFSQLNLEMDVFIVDCLTEDKRLIVMSVIV